MMTLAEAISGYGGQGLGAIGAFLGAWAGQHISKRALRAMLAPIEQRLSRVERAVGLTSNQALK